MKERDRKVSFWYGGRSSREIFYYRTFQSNRKGNFQTSSIILHFQNHWQKTIGLVIPDLYTTYYSKTNLKNHPEPEDLEYYICGPPMMNAAVFKMLDDLGVPPENIAFDDFGG